MYDAASTEDLVGQQALQASEIRYRRLFGAARDGILILDAESGEITAVNSFLADLLGYSQREIEEFHMQFARETGDAVPILLHNFPQVTSKLEFELMRKLIDTGRFAGIKDSSGDWPLFEQLLELRQTRPFALFNGDDRTARQALAVSGADGVAWYRILAAKLVGWPASLPETM